MGNLIIFNSNERQSFVSSSTYEYSRALDSGSWTVQTAREGLRGSSAKALTAGVALRNYPEPNPD